MDAPREITLLYSRSVVARAVRQFIWQRAFVAQKGLWLAEAFMLGLLAWLVNTAQPGWLISLVAIAVMLPPLMVLVAWLVWQRRKQAQLRKMPSRRAQLVIGAGGMDVTSQAGSARICWDQVTEYWLRPDYVMVFTGPRQFVTLPLGASQAHDRALLKARLAGRVAG